MWLYKLLEGQLHGKIRAVTEDGVRAVREGLETVFLVKFTSSNQFCSCR